MVDQALMMIADIGGYTQYMRLHRLSLAHSQDITGRLLKAVVRAAPELKLIEVEGDAAFLYAPIDAERTSPTSVAAQLALTMHRAFHAEQDRMIALNMCSCPGCVEAGQLRVKFVAHVGEVAIQTIKRHAQLVGLDVIVVHRMLKNSVPIEEYVLMSEPVYRQSPPNFRDHATGVEHDLESPSTPAPGRSPTRVRAAGSSNRDVAAPAAPDVGGRLPRHAANAAQAAAPRSS